MKPTISSGKKHSLDDDRAKLDVRVNEMSYDTAAIRELLTAAFDDQELTIFCFDYFRPVYDNFTSEMGHLLKIQRLIDHCERHNKFDRLLTLVQQTNSVQYYQFIPAIRKPPRTLSADRWSAAIDALADVIGISPQEIDEVRAEFCIDIPPNCRYDIQLKLTKASPSRWMENNDG